MSRLLAKGVVMNRRRFLGWVGALPFFSYAKADSLFIDEVPPGAISFGSPGPGITTDYAEGIAITPFDWAESRAAFIAYQMRETMERNAYEVLTGDPKS